MAVNLRPTSSRASHLLRAVRHDLQGGSRLIVHEPVRDELVAEVVERAEAIT